MLRLNGEYLCNDTYVIVNLHTALETTKGPLQVYKVCHIETTTNGAFTFTNSPILNTSIGLEADPGLLAASQAVG